MIFGREGFIDTAKDWDENLAKVISLREGVASLEEKHWRVINYLRDYYLENKRVPVMKHVCHELNLDEGCVSELFGDPEKSMENIWFARLW